MNDKAKEPEGQDAVDASPKSSAIQPPSKRQRRLRLLRGWLVAILVVVGIIAGVQWLIGGTPPLEVRVTGLERGTVERTVTSTRAGSIRSRRESSLSVETAGRIVAIHVREGDMVEAGDSLLKIDPRLAAANFLIAEKEVQVLEARLEEAESQHREALLDLRRIEGLSGRDTIPEAEIDSARTRVEVAVAAVSAASASIQAQRTVVERNRVAMEQCELHAPFDGVIAEVEVEVGEWATPGQIVIRMLDPDAIYVEAELDEVDLSELRPGLPVRVTLDPYKDEELPGRVVRVAPYVSELEEQNRTVQVDVELTGDLEGLHLKPGTSADVEVILETAEDVLRLPSLALMEGNRVYVIDAEGRARTVELEVGIRNWDYAQITGGLEEGDEVIVSLESAALTEGVPVVEEGEAHE